MPQDVAVFDAELDPLLGLHPAIAIAHCALDSYGTFHRVKGRWRIPIKEPLALWS
jgi:hypothetical protein